jgi:hypothetical protein
MKDETKSRRRARRWVSIVLTFFLLLSILVTTGMTVLHYTILSPGYLVKQIYASGYAAKQYDHYMDAISVYAVSSGFPEKFFLDMVAERDFTEDFIGEATRLYNEDAPAIDEAALGKNLREQLEAYAKKQGAEITPEIGGALDYLTSLCVSAYRSDVSFPLFSTLQSMLARAAGLAPKALTAAVVLFVVLFVVLLLIQRHKSSVLRYLSYAFGAAAIFLAAISLYVKFGSWIERISFDGAMYNLVTTYAKEVFSPIWILTACYAAVAVVFAFVYADRRRAADKYRYRRPGQ